MAQQVIDRNSADCKWNIDKGTTFDITYTWKQGATVATATEVDLTDCTASLKGYKTDGTEAFTEQTTVNGGIALGGVNGTVRVILDDTLTGSFDFNKATFRLDITFPSGAVNRFIRGDINAYDEDAG